MITLDNGHDLNKRIEGEIAYKRLKEIEKTWKCITPKLVIDDATDPESPLHNCFEWNDSKGARKWRERQAGALIRSIHIEKLDKNNMPFKIRAFVSVPNADKFILNVEESTVYKDIETVFKNADEKKYVLAKALRELTLWKTRYEHLEEFGKVVKEIDKVLA